MLLSFIKNLLLFTVLGTLYPISSYAQIIPDNTLGGENSTIRSIDQLRDAIEGGAIRGENLFHSFQEFNVGEALEVYFANPEGIANIFSRVTGNNVSEIFGTLGVDGTANLFLMNPNGIVFGENAALDVGGSFMATTAESLDFNSGESFSAVEREKPLLTIDFPIGLGMGSNPGNIEVRGEQNNVVVEVPSIKVNTDRLPSAIKVNTNQNISLIGGNISFDGGGLQAPGGDLELVSVDSNQTVTLIQSSNWFDADFSNAIRFRNISLKNAAYIDTSSEKAGNINLSGREILIDEGSAILANTYLDSNSKIEINAAESLTIKGSSGQVDADQSLQEIEQIVSENSPTDNNGNSYSVSLIGADVLSGTNGRGNNININTKDLKIFDAGQIRTVNFSQGNNFAGNINVKASNILIEGTNNIDDLITSVINSSTGIGSTGNSGNVNIYSGVLRLEKGGRIKVDSFGSGSGGNLAIKSEDLVMKGSSLAVDSIFTGLSTTSSLVLEENNDFIGNIDIETKTLKILDGARISADSFGRNSAGKITIDADLIHVAGSIVPFEKFFPSSITASVDRSRTAVNLDSAIDLANSQAGDIMIKSNKLQVFDGASIEAFTTRGNSGNIIIEAQQIELNGTKPRVGNFIGGLSVSTLVGSFGNGGSIDLTTDSLKVLNGSIIRAISLGSGDAGSINIDAQTIEIAGVDRFAENPFDNRRVSKINTGAANTNGGNLNINSDSLILDNFGLLQAVTQGTGTGGNINLNTENLELFGQSQITASAGRDGNGGNITIDTQTLLGLENSDITANAFQGNGGNIEITAERIFGIEERASLTTDSDITADSQLGIDGTVTINAPDLDDEEFVKAAVQDFLNFVELPRGKCEGEAFLNSFPLKIGGLIQPESPYDFLDYNQDDEAYRAIEQIKQGTYDFNEDLEQLNPEDLSELNLDSDLEQLNQGSDPDLDSDDWQPGDPIIEPNAVRVDADGRKFLVRVNEEEEIPPAEFCTSQKESD